MSHLDRFLFEPSSGTDIFVKLPELERTLQSIFFEPLVTDLTSIRFHLAKIYELLLIAVTRSSCLTGLLGNISPGLPCPVCMHCKTDEGEIV